MKSHVLPPSFYSLCSTVTWLKKNCPQFDRFYRHTRNMPCSGEPFDTLLLFTQSQVLCALQKLFLIRTQKVPLLLNLMDELLAGMWNCPGPHFGSKKVLFLEVGHAVIEVFTTRQKCDGTENVGDSDAWLNRLLCTDCRAALWIVMPLFIVLRLKGSPIRQQYYSTSALFDTTVHRTKTMSAKPDGPQKRLW